MATDISIRQSTSQINIKDQLQQPVLFTGSTYNIHTDERTTWHTTLSFKPNTSSNIDYHRYTVNGYGISQWRTEQELRYMIIGNIDCKTGQGKVSKIYINVDTLEQHSIIYNIQLYMLRNTLHINMYSDISSGTLMKST